MNLICFQFQKFECFQLEPLPGDICGLVATFHFFCEWLRPRCNGPTGDGGDWYGPVAAFRFLSERMRPHPRMRDALHVTLSPATVVTGTRQVSVESFASGLHVSWKLQYQRTRCLGIEELPLGYQVAHGCAVQQPKIQISSPSMISCTFCTILQHLQWNLP